MESELTGHKSMVRRIERSLERKYHNNVINKAAVATALLEIAGLAGAPSHEARNAIHSVLIKLDWSE